MFSTNNIFTILLLIIIQHTTHTKASDGDSSPYYQKCVQKCTWTNCTDDESDFLGENKQSISLIILSWSCGDECRYICMWKTVDAFNRRNWNTPQFHGKWPFVRFVGVQEPASVMFSLLNFFAHLKMIRKFRQEVRSDAPLYWLWHIYSLVCLHAWIWSAIFHTRDFPFTEFMDYSCAFSMVLISFYCLLIRLLRKLPRFVLVILSTFILAFYANHVAYLKLGRFDYSYNMQVNIIAGTLTAIIWFGWCTWNRKRQPYVWKCAVYVSLTGLTLLLEVIDRPPIFWVFDSHALWHLSTVPLVYLFYSFIIDDCKQLRKEMDISAKAKKE